MMYGLQAFVLFHFVTWFGQNALGSEIINGKRVQNNSMLYMASLQIDSHHVCGGFLVSEDYVITAAHCDKPKLEKVVIGTHDLKKVSENAVRRIESKCKHPSYDNYATGYDIMLLKLSKKVDKRIKPIKLPQINNKIKDKEKCNVAGWGSTKTGGKSVDVLQWVDVPFVNLDVCREQWKPKLKLPANVMCAGGYKTTKGFCQGDSGGPLVCNGMAVGVVSFNWYANCDYPNAPNVYTDISKYVAWINDIIKQKKKAKCKPA